MQSGFSSGIRLQGTETKITEWGIRLMTVIQLRIRLASQRKGCSRSLAVLWSTSRALKPAALRPVKSDSGLVAHVQNLVHFNVEPLSRHPENSRCRFPDTDFAGNYHLLEGVTDTQVGKNVIESAIEIGDDPEAYLQAAEARSRVAEHLGKFPDTRAGEHLVDCGKIIVERDYLIACRLHGPGHQSRHQFRSSSGRGPRIQGAERRSSKSIPKCILNAIGIQVIAEKPRRLGISRARRTEQPDQSACGIEGDDTNHWKQLRISRMQDPVCTHFRSQLRETCLSVPALLGEPLETPEYLIGPVRPA